MEKRNKKGRNSSVKLKKRSSEKLKQEANTSNKQDVEEIYNKLKLEEEQLDKEIAELEKQGIDTDLKPQMEALHQYNEIKDATQSVLGYLANIEQTTVAELHKLYNLPTD